MQPGRGCDTGCVVASSDRSAGAHGAPDCHSLAGSYHRHGHVGPGYYPNYYPGYYPAERLADRRGGHDDWHW